MHTVLPYGNKGYYVRSPGGRVVENYPVNLHIPHSQANALAAAQAHANRLNGNSNVAQVA